MTAEKVGYFFSMVGTRRYTHEAVVLFCTLYRWRANVKSTSFYGCLFSFFLSNLIIFPPDFKGWGRVLFCSNQIKPRTREHRRAGARAGSRQVSSVFFMLINFGWSHL